jgi:hypothetical protein
MLRGQDTSLIGGDAFEVAGRDLAHANIPQLDLAVREYPPVFGLDGGHGRPIPLTAARAIMIAAKTTPAQKRALLVSGDRAAKPQAVSIPIVNPGQLAGFLMVVPPILQIVVLVQILQIVVLVF